MNYNYQYNRTNTPYQGASWAHQNNSYGQGASQANRRMDHQYNSSNWRYQQKRLQTKAPRLPKFLRQSKSNRQGGTKNSKGSTQTNKQSVEKEKEKDKDNQEKEKKAVGTFMMVVNSQYPVKLMSTEQLDSLRSEILRSIDSIEVGAFRPQFLECFKKKGALVIDCHNQESIDWLKNSVQTLAPWEGAQFRVIQPGKAVIQMIIIHSRYPWEVFDFEQIDTLKGEIIKVVEELPRDDFVPQFLNCFRQRGTLVVDCNDQESADWLKNSVPSLLTSWDGPEIVVTEPEQVPSLKYLQLCIPGSVEEPERILLRLQHQNKGINAKDWHFVRMKKETNITNFFVAVCDDVVNFLKELNFKLFLNFGKITIKNMGKFRPILAREPKSKGNEDSGKQENEDKDQSKPDSVPGELTDNITEEDEIFTEVDELLTELEDSSEKTAEQ